MTATGSCGFPGPLLPGAYALSFILSAGRIGTARAWQRRVAPRR